jgi:poly(3-hydroxybutyrate) depolymerase
MPRPLSHALGALCACALAATPLAAQELPRLDLDPGATTVSGLSSGAFMAVQMQVAFSDRIAGAGIVAGGPYWCARGSATRAVSACMAAPGGRAPDITRGLAQAEAYAAEGAIAPLAGLADDRVFLFSGTEDEVVRPPVMAAAAAFYAAIGVPGATMRVVDDVAAGHAILLEEAENPCDANAFPWLNDCDRDQAGNILSWLYGDLAPPVPARADRLFHFDQSGYLTRPAAVSMFELGLVYIPQACSAGARCRLHIALHGCGQGADALEDRFAREAGFNAWAEANDIVVLYPQAQADAARGNPLGCWDWWGYTGEAYATRAAPQMGAIARMSDALGAALADAVCTRHDAFNWRHWWEDRAEICGFFGFCAAGSGAPLGAGALRTTLHESAPGMLHAGGCP